MKKKIRPAVVFLISLVLLSQGRTGEGGGSIRKGAHNAQAQVPPWLIQISRLGVLKTYLTRVKRGIPSLLKIRIHTYIIVKLYDYTCIIENIFPDKNNNLTMIHLEKLFPQFYMDTLCKFIVFRSLFHITSLNISVTSHFQENNITLQRAQRKTEENNPSIILYQYIYLYTIILLNIYTDKLHV